MWTLRQRSWLGILVVAALAAVAALWVVGPAVSKQKGPAVLVSASADRTKPETLENRSLYGNIYVFLDPSAANAKRVRWYLDDPKRVERPARVLGKPPFDLAGATPAGSARPFSVAPLAHGKHTLTAVIERTDGTQQIVHSTFVVRRLFVAPSGSDAANCGPTDPCLSFGRAYSVAGPGQVVEVAGGEYGPQDIDHNVTERPADRVIFAPKEGESVVVTGQVDVSDKGIEFRDMAFAGGWYARPGSEDITFRNIKSKFLFITSATDIRVIGGEIYPGPDFLVDCSDANRKCDFDSQISSAPDGGPPPTNILIDHVNFHGWLRPPGTDWHTECLQFGSGVNVTIRNSRFWDCATHDIFVLSWGGTNYPLRNWVIENNYFGLTPDGYYSIRIGNQEGIVCENFLVRYNTALQNMYSDCQASNVRFTANIEPTGERFQCQATAGAVWDYNVYQSGTRCGPHDRVGPSTFVDQDAMDLRLKPGSAAVNRGDPKNYPLTDFQGDRRPQGKRPDAGADELR